MPIFAGIFIMTKDYPSLDGQYAAFGRIIKGLDVLTKLNTVKTGTNDKPLTPVVIESVTVDTKVSMIGMPQLDNPKGMLIAKVY